METRACTCRPKQILLRNAACSPFSLGCVFHTFLWFATGNRAPPPPPRPSTPVNPIHSLQSVFTSQTSHRRLLLSTAHVCFRGKVTGSDIMHPPPSILYLSDYLPPSGYMMLCLRSHDVVSPASESVRAVRSHFFSEINDPRICELLLNGYYTL